MHLFKWGKRLFQIQINLGQLANFTNSMDSHIYFNTEYIHAPVPLNSQPFDFNAHIYNSQQPLLTFPTPSELMVDLASTTGQQQDLYNLAQFNSVQPPHLLDQPVPEIIQQPLFVPPEPTLDSARKAKKRPAVSSTTHGSTFVPTDP